MDQTGSCPEEYANAELVFDHRRWTPRYGTLYGPGTSVADYQRVGDSRSGTVFSGAGRIEAPSLLSESKKHWSRGILNSG